VIVVGGGGDEEGEGEGGHDGVEDHAGGAGRSEFDGGHSIAAEDHTGDAGRSASAGGDLMAGVVRPGESGEGVTDSEMSDGGFETAPTVGLGGEGMRRRRLTRGHPPPGVDTAVSEFVGEDERGQGASASRRQSQSRERRLFREIGCFDPSKSPYEESTKGA
jgi:hypothetical protein